MSAIDDDIPPPVETEDDKGVITRVEYRITDEGKKIKLTSRIRRSKVKKEVLTSALNRRNCRKFGVESGKGPGVDTGITSVGEDMYIKVHVGGIKNEEPEEKADQPKSKTISCRNCGGDHFTNHCPYKDTFALAKEEPEEPAPSAGGPSRYVPPSLRAGATPPARGTAASDGCTVRVSNLPEETIEPDMHALFSRFGHVRRAFVGKDHNTGLCKGFAYVTFDMSSSARHAAQAVNGHPYGNLILNCEISVK